MERVGNLLGQIASLKPRKTAGGASDSVASSGESTKVDSGPRARSINSDAPSSVKTIEMTTASTPRETTDRTRQYPSSRRRAGAPTDLTRIKAILSKALAHKGLDKKIERYEFILHWQEIVGETLARISKPECIVNRTLIVRVVHSTWAQELAFMKPVLIQKVTPYLKRGDMLDDIVFRIGSVR